MSNEDKKQVTPLEVFVGFVIFAAIILVVQLWDSNFDNTPVEIKSIEEHAKYDGHNRPVNPEFQAKVIKIAVDTKQAIEESDVDEKTISLDDAEELMSKGDEALLDSEGKSFVYHNKLNMYFSLSHFASFVHWYDDRGKNFFDAHLVAVIKPNGEQQLDKNKNPGYTLDLIAEDIQYIYKKTGIWLDLKSMIRDENYKLVIWGRSLQHCLDTGADVKGLSNIGFYLSKATGNSGDILARCSRGVREDNAAKPSTMGHGHAALDIGNWKNPKVYALLIELGYIGGCESTLWPGDGWHFSPVTKRASTKKKKKCLRETGL